MILKDEDEVSVVQFGTGDIEVEAGMFEVDDHAKPSNTISHLEAEIERVSNGFIVSGHKADDRSKKTFFNSLERLADDYIIENLRDTDRMFREHDECGRKMKIVFTLADIE